MARAHAQEQPVPTDLPFRIDRLPWSRWHWMVVIALGVTWILDGLEVTIVGSVGPRLQERGTLALGAEQVGEAATAYLIGAVLGSLLFGHLTDRLGRRKLFLFTLALYAVATLCTAFSTNFVMFAVFRLFTGMAIGGEYSAINSTIDELIPSKRRGVADLAVNGTFWFGTLLGSAATLLLLDEHRFAANVGWRLAFGSGAVGAVVIMFVRGHVPESPRWLLAHGRRDDAERIVGEIERHVRDERGTLPPDPVERITIRPHHGGIAAVAATMLRDYPKRTILCLGLMISQAFLFNAIFFTQGLVLTTFFNVPAADVGAYVIPFAVAALLGPILLGHFFDTLGRRVMIGGTYAIAAAGLAVTAVLFIAGKLDARTITAAWAAIFFFASAGASAAYLTVSEIFPVETRALAIAIVYAAGTLFGGAIAPTIFGAISASKQPGNLFWGYIAAAVVMGGGALLEAVLGVDAERQPLERIARPLGAVEAAPL